MMIGLNMYTLVYERANPESAKGYDDVEFPKGYPTMNMPWLKIGPQITDWGPKHLADIWGVKSVYITESGCAAKDVINPDSEILDTDRIMY